MAEPVVRARAEAKDSGAFDREFVQAATELRRDPYRAGLLPPALESRLLSMPRAFPAEFWLAERAGRVVGRIGANLSPVHRSAGYVGFFEVDLGDPDPDAVGRALFSAAETWIAADGRGTVIGPLTFHTWLPYRFRLGDPAESFPWEPVNPPRYVAMFEDRGFVVDARYRSEAVTGLDAFVEATRDAWRVAVGRGYTFRRVDRGSFLSAEVHALTVEAFADAYLIEPIPAALFEQLNVPLAERYGFENARFVYDAAGEMAGYFFAFEDRSGPIPWLVWKTIALRRDQRGCGLSNALMHEVTREAVARGVDRAIAALFREGAQSGSYSRKCPVLWRHEYALFRQELSGVRDGAG